MNANEIQSLTNTTQLTDLSPFLDFKRLDFYPVNPRRVGAPVRVLWKGEARGEVATEVSDRTYHVARDVWGEACVCVGDSLGEAVLALVPELAEIEAR